MDSWGVFDSCSEYKLLDRKPPRVNVDTKLQGDELEHLLVPQQDQERTFLLGDTSFGGWHGFQCIECFHFLDWRRVASKASINVSLSP